MSWSWALSPLLLSASACPGSAQMEVQAPATYRPGEPLLLRALVSLSTGATGASGRGHLALRLPPGWQTSGRYRLGGSAFELHPAAVVSARYEEAHRVPGARWIGFVTFFHTGLPSRTTVSADLTLRPPATAVGPVSIKIALGPAPPYPGWDGDQGPQATVSLRAAP